MGLKRGFILQLFHLVGYFVAFFIARKYYDTLAPKLSLWIPYPDLMGGSQWAVFLKTLPLENAFYYAISFATIFFATKIALQIITTILASIAAIPIIRPINKLLGAALVCLACYFISFIVSFIPAL